MDGVMTVRAGDDAAGWHEAVGPLAVRLCRLQGAGLAGGAVLLLPPGVLPETGDAYCGWPVLRVAGVPEPMIGLPGRARDRGAGTERKGACPCTT